MRRTLWLGVILLGMALALAGCDKKADAPKKEEKTGGEEAVTKGGDAAKVAALVTAFAESPDCQLLVACCASVPGSTWEQTLTPFCDQVASLQNFEEAVKNMTDPAFLAKDCENRVAGLSGMGSGGNPLPGACQKGGAADAGADPAAPAAGADPMCTALCAKGAETMGEDAELQAECNRRCNIHLTYGGPHREVVEQVHRECMDKTNLGDMSVCIGKVNADWQAEGKPRDGSDWIQWDYDSICEKGKGCNEGE